MAKQSVTVTVNGTRYQRDIEPRLLLSDFVRHELSLTGTHVGCEHGVCGSCTVLLEGVATQSCLCLAVQADRTVRRDGRVAWKCGRTASAAAGVLGKARSTVWFLYARNADVRCRSCCAQTQRQIAMPSSRPSAATCAAVPATRTLSRRSSTPSNCCAHRRRPHNEPHRRRARLFHPAASAKSRAKT